MSRGRSMGKGLEVGKCGLWLQRGEGKETLG